MDNNGTGMKDKYQISYWKNNLLLSIFLFVFSSCYTVNEHTYLNIVFNESKLNAIYLNKYVDSVQNKGIIIPDSINQIFFNDDTIRDNERLIQFENKPQEWYLIDFDASPCWIEAIYNPTLSSFMIHDKRFISAAELTRIRNRFQSEILNKSEAYGKNHHIADSILYNLKYK